MERIEIKRDLFLIFIAAAVLLLWGLGSGSICSWDEGLYGGVTREMLKTGDFINLRWQGSAWSDKPPLYMWMTAFFAGFLGLNELSVRLFSALCGIGTVLVTYLIALRLYSRRVAAAAAIILLTTWHFIWSSRLGMLDIPMTFFTSLTFLLFIKGEENKNSLFFVPVIFGLAFMVKGWGALIIPAILFLYAVSAGKHKLFLETRFIAGVFAGMVIPVVWHWMVFAQYGDSFIKNYVTKHLVMRTTHAVEGHTGNYLTYFSVIPNKGRIWAGIALPVVPYLVWRIFRYKEKNNIFPVVWALTVFILFSLVKTKLHWYIIPIYPALAIITAVAFASVFRKYTIYVVISVAIFSIIYLGMDKGIFDLDYSPELKEISVKVHQAVPADTTLFMYDAGDPGLQFYLGDIARSLNTPKELSGQIEQKGTVLLISRSGLKEVGDTRYTFLGEFKDYVLIRTR